MHRIEAESKAHNVAPCSLDSAPILNGEQHETVEDYEVAPNDPGCNARAHTTASLSD